LGGGGGLAKTKPALDGRMHRMERAGLLKVDAGGEKEDRIIINTGKKLMGKEIEEDPGVLGN